MSVAIALRLDAATVSLIDAMLDAIPDRRTGTRYSPHIKLAVIDDAVDVADLDAALRMFTAKWTRVPVTLAGVGFFGGEPANLWLAVAPTAELMAYHATLPATLAKHTCDPHYEVGAWLPHVELATTEFLGDAMEVLACAWTGPISGTLDFLDLVRLETGEVISSRPLWD